MDWKPHSIAFSLESHGPSINRPSGSLGLGGQDETYWYTPIAQIHESKVSQTHHLSQLSEDLREAAGLEGDELEGLHLCCVSQQA